MISADNAHAKHPNYPEMSDVQNSPILGGGVAVKYNANQRYTTDARSDAVFRTICKRAGVSVQSYSNRADMPGGSTLGNISTTRVSISSVDIGIPQLGMHSSTETVAYSDFESMIDAMSEFYSSKILTDGQNIKIV
jgi:aspartyl aminopeptidase